MTQTIFDENSMLIKESKLDKLYKLRKQYYKEFRNDITSYEIKLKQSTQSYINTIKDIDKEIHKELKTQKVLEGKNGKQK